MLSISLSHLFLYLHLSFSSHLFLSMSLSHPRSITRIFRIFVSLTLSIFLYNLNSISNIYIHMYIYLHIFLHAFIHTVIHMEQFPHAIPLSNVLPLAELAEHFVQVNQIRVTINQLSLNYLAISRDAAASRVSSCFALPTSF